MIFNSVQFLLFLPLVIVIHYIIPKRIRCIWLLIASYYFYMCWNPRYAILIMISTLATYLGGLGIELSSTKYCCKKVIFIGCLIINLGILFFFKYFEWILENLNRFFYLQISVSFNFILPVGISFYTFQALSYLIDVYKGDIKAERNIIRYALFVSFFPQLVAGPIERSRNLLSQIEQITGEKFAIKNIRDGLCLILYGFFLKIVLADRAATLVNIVFDNYTAYGFVELAMAAVLFAFQILCDFNGYTIIAQGSACMLGIKLMDNFRQPYLALSIRDFWRRWHISLTSWFTDYLYIPLGGSKKGFFRKIINTMIVFGVSGLWHGASWHFVVWGVLHGIYLNMENSIRLLKKRIHFQNKILKFSDKMICTLAVFFLTDIAWVFFRSASVKNALLYFMQMTFSYQNTSLLSLGLQWYDWLILIISITIMFIVDVLHEKGLGLRTLLYRERLWLRWLIYLAAFWGILMFGIYGVSYDASQFIYFQF